jgi:ABC-type dipeptide/oligopeptide/nickel transport system ATPase component
MATESLLQVRNLQVGFRSQDGVTEAVKGISFNLEKGATLAIVGESGSGKSVTALSLTKLLPSPPAEITGEILFEGENVLNLPPARLRQVRGGGIAYVFQEPSTSLNPVFTIRNQIREAIQLHRPEVKDLDGEVVKWLSRVGIVDPEKRMRDYPHQLSGGMQQRVMIAMALSCGPRLLVADEPTTALDVTIQAQILGLLKELREKEGMALILITHNFGIIRGIADRVAVMFRGKIVEEGLTDEVLSRPQHPYTKALIRCIPKAGEHKRRLDTIDYSEIEAAK